MRVWYGGLRGASSLLCFEVDEQMTSQSRVNFCHCNTLEMCIEFLLHYTALGTKDLIAGGAHRERVD